MIDRNVDRRTVEEIDGAGSESSGQPWWGSLRTVAARLMDELVMGLAVSGIAMHGGPLLESTARKGSAGSRTLHAPGRMGSIGLNLTLVSVASEARRLLGDRASEWMVTPNRSLDGITPAELATSPEGAREVLHELGRPRGTVPPVRGT